MSRRPLALLLALPVLAAAKLTDALPRPTSPYAGDVTLRAGEDAVRGRVHGTPDRLRLDLTVQGRPTAVVLALDDDTAITWTADVPLVMAFDLDKGELPARYTDYETLTLEPDGDERVNGVDANRFRVAGRQADGADFTGTLWMTAENVPVRLDGVARSPERGRTPIRADVTNLELGPQDAALFRPPEDASRVQGGGLFSEETADRARDAVRDLGGAVRGWLEGR